MIILTGGAGFIGSALLHELNRRGRTDVLVVDVIDHPRKARNLAPLQFRELVGIHEFRRALATGQYDQCSVTGFLHMGACSATTETDWNYLADNNVEYSQEILRWCVDHKVRCVYASSGATYGDGAQGFSDDHSMFHHLQPLNLYGRSKLAVDIWARDKGYLASVAGLRYFNVFGPNEWHKEGMRSVVNKKFPELRDHGFITLFKSYDGRYADGTQERDFIYVRDIVDMTLWFLDHHEASGVFNLGSGRARTWNDMAQAMFAAAKRTPRIVYVDMPDDLKKQYQYHTQAGVSKLRAAGYTKECWTLENAISDYVCGHLLPDAHLGE